MLRGDWGMNEIIPLEAEKLYKCFRFWDFEFNMEKRKRIENDIISGKRSMYVFEYAGKYIAGVSISAYDQDACYISYLAVEENYRNKGIGTALIKFACDYAWNRNFKKILLEVDYDNVGARKLYQKLGFSDGEINLQSRISMIKHLT